MLSDPEKDNCSTNWLKKGNEAYFFTADRSENAE